MFILRVISKVSSDSCFPSHKDCSEKGLCPRSVKSIGCYAAAAAPHISMSQHCTRSTLLLALSHSPLLPARFASDKLIKVTIWASLFRPEEDFQSGLSGWCSGQQPLLLRPWSNLSQHWVTSGRGGQLASRQQSCEASSRLLSASIRGESNHTKLW